MGTANAAVKTNGHVKQGAIDTAQRIEVPKLLNDEQVRFFVENGYYIAPNLVAADELEELKTDTNQIARGHTPTRRCSHCRRT